ncbi:MAG: substrate-binding domain-containing protein [Lachnospiraceae bacterium]
MKKLIAVLMITALTTTALVGCGNTTKEPNTDTNQTTTNSTSTGNISVVSREDGSGTRGAFTELFDVEEKSADGSKVDHTTEEAIIANNTEMVLSNVSGDPNAIGYVSLGSLNDSVKALKIDGADATVANIKNDTYKISRPFNIATKGTSSDAAQDFINFILSTQGQDVVEKNGYITSVENAAAFKSNQASGKIVIAGSSSISPVMEKLIEAFKPLNKSIEIELQQSDSTTGLQAAMDGTADIGMASRELKDSESSLTGTVIAIDGIAVVVNNKNTVNEMTSAEVKAIFIGETTGW